MDEIRAAIDGIRERERERDARIAAVEKRVDTVGLMI